MNALDKIEKKYIEDFGKRSFQELKKSKDKEEGKGSKEAKKDEPVKEEEVVVHGKDVKPVDRTKIFTIGDTIKVFYKIVEGKRERIQSFEGYAIGANGKGINKTFKVRKISYGVGVERTFPLFSPNIAKIELVKKGKIRRAKLYYLRERSGKKAIIKEKISFKK